MSDPIATLTALHVDFEDSGSEIPALRRTRRAHVSPEFLKAKKLLAGDWVLLRAAGAKIEDSTVEKPLGWIVAQLWPRIGLDDESEFHDQLVVLTTALALCPGQISNLGTEQVELFKFPTAGSKGILKNVTVKLLSEPKPSKGSDEAGQKREVEWQRAAVKEALAAVKYVAPNYVVTLSDEETQYVVTEFEVSAKAAAARAATADALAQELKSLNLSDFPDVYEVEWRTKVSLATDEEGKSGSGPSKSSVSFGGKP